MRTIKVKVCDCGEDVYEDDFSREIDGIKYLGCINCAKEYAPSELVEEEITEITH